MIEPWKALSTSLLLALTLLGCDRSVRVTPEDAGVVAEATPNSMEAGLPPVMATARPRQRRWFARADMIEPVLDTPAVSETAAALGYHNRSEWV